MIHNQTNENSGQGYISDFYLNHNKGKRPMFEDTNNQDEEIT